MLEIRVREQLHSDPELYANWDLILNLDNTYELFDGGDWGMFKVYDVSIDFCESYSRIVEEASPVPLSAVGGSSGLVRLKQLLEFT